MISVVVVNYNRAPLLQRCLRSLRDQTLSDLEVVVVDNGSEDDSRAVVEAIGADDPRFRLIRLDRNLGFAAGCNRGISATAGDLVALLNNDAEADPEWLQELNRAARQYPACGMFAAKILFHGTETIDKAGHLIFPDGQNRGRGTGEPDRGQYDREEPALFPDGCAALYRRELLRETAGFCEDFFAYGDDADLGLRARWLGWDCRYIPAARVYHRHSSTTGRFHQQKVYWVERNRLWVAVRTFPLPLLLFNPFFSLYRWKWNLVATLAGRGPAGGFRRQTSYGALLKTTLRATWDGLRGLKEHIRARHRLMARRRLSTRRFLALLWRFRISARTLAFQEWNDS